MPWLCCKTNLGKQELYLRCRSVEWMVRKDSESPGTQREPPPHPGQSLEQDPCPLALRRLLSTTTTQSLEPRLPRRKGRETRAILGGCFIVSCSAHERSV